MKQTTLDTYFRKRKIQDSDEISCKRSCSQELIAPNDTLLQSNNQMICGSIRVISEEKLCSVSPNDMLTQEDYQMLHDNTVASKSANTAPVLCQGLLNSTFTQESDQIAHGSAIANGTLEAKLVEPCGVSPPDDLREEEVLHDNPVGNTSVNTSPMVRQLSFNGTSTQKIDEGAHGSDIPSNNLEAGLSKVCGATPDVVLRQENDQLFYGNAVASTSADSLWNKNAVSNTDSESETPMVCEVSPDAVTFENIKSLNKRINIKRTPRKTSKSAAMNSVPFILHTIDQYDKHLRTSGALDGILKDDSLDLLSTWADLTEPAQRIVCYLYCIDHEEQLEMISDEIKTAEIEEIKTSLSEKGFIILGSEGNTDGLTLSELNEICKKLNLKPSPSKIKAKKNLSLYMNTTNIMDWFKGSNKTDIRKRDSEVSEELKLKLKKKWKLSDHARETINELLILMHLDNIFNMGCSLDPTKRKDNRPAIKFKPPVITKCYPVDKEMIVDNASLIFQDRQEFCRYLEAYAFYKNYKVAQSKCDIVLDAHKLYTEITRNEERMLRNWILPMWLRRFTPADLYVDILEDGVSHLKKSQLGKKNKKALEVLDSLISQLTFRQHKKAEWYDMKYNIQLKCLRSVTKAARTLKEACEANLPEETVYTLRHRAKQIVDKSRIDQNLLKALRVHANKDILENSIPGPEYFYQPPIKKTNSRNRPKYMWKDEPVFAEAFCCNRYKQGDSLKIGEHWEGKIVTTIYFLLFWDIIYTKPLGVSGIFMSHYQLYPLDMWCESFYINRKTWIDNFLVVIEKSTSDEIVEKMLMRWKDSAKYDVPDIVRSIDWGYIETVVRLLGPRAVAAICRRLAQNYEYTRHGFPDLTLCREDSIKFREVKTDKDKAHAHQMQWLLYLIKHNIDASICYLRDNPEQQPRENNEISNSETEFDQSHGERTEEALDSSK